MSDHIESTSDQRIVNNVMRHEYRVLSEADKDNMGKIKDLGLEMWNLIEKIGNQGAPDRGPGSRELSLAKTKVEEAVMWAVKHITR